MAAAAARRSLTADDAGRSEQGAPAEAPGGAGRLRTRYLAYVGDIAEKWLDWKRLGPIVAEYEKLIADDVARDTRKLDSTEAFTLGIYGPADGTPPPASTIKGFADQRRAALLSHPDISRPVTSSYALGVAADVPASAPRSPRAGETRCQSPGLDRGGRQREDGEPADGSEDHESVGRGGLKEQTGNEPSNGPEGGQSQNGAYRNLKGGIPYHSGSNPPRMGAQGDSEARFPGARGDRRRSHGIDADDGEEHAGAGKQSHQKRAESLRAGAFEQDIIERGNA